MPNTTRLLRGLDRLLSRAEAALLAGIILCCGLLLFANVVLRYLFLSPIYWAEELSRYLMIWMIFLGAGRVAGEEGHISVSVLTERFPPRLARAWDILVAVSCLLFCCVLAYFSLRHALRIRSTGQLTPALELPMWLAYLAVPTGAASMALCYALRLAAGTRTPGHAAGGSR